MKAIKAKLLNAVEWTLAFLLLLAIAALIFVVTTAHAAEVIKPQQPELSQFVTFTPPRPVQVWTLWETVDEVPTLAVLRFTSLDACIAISYRYGFTNGATATCLPYRLGDFSR